MINCVNESKNIRSESVMDFEDKKISFRTSAASLNCCSEIKGTLPDFVAVPSNPPNFPTQC